MDELDPVLHQPQRLRLMALLFRSRQASFTTAREELQMTPGNLGSHAQRLEEAGYIESARALVGRGFELRYRITARGSEAFRAYLAQLRAILDAAEEPSHGEPASPEPWAKPSEMSSATSAERPT